MKVLLINPITSEKRMYTCTPNLGLAYLATSLRKHGYRVDLFDGMKKGMTKKDLEERLKKTDYSVAGLQVYTCSVDEARDTIGTIRALDPDIVTITGGAHPSCDPENSLNTLKSDFAFRGEAEIGLPLLLKHIRDSGTTGLEDIPNLIWKDNGRTICNPLEPIPDLDTVGMPSWDLIAPNEYPNAPIGGFVKNFPLATISCTRGCTHHCTYCANSMIMGGKLRTRTSRSILDEMSLLYREYGVKEFQIIDDCFTSSRALAISVCKGIIESKMEISISFPNGVRVESLDRELIELLEKAGCYSLGLGIESGSQRIIDHMKRGQKLEAIKEKIQLIKNISNIRLSGFFIIGYPEETEKDILDTIRFAKQLPLSKAQFTVWMPVPGSEMTNKLLIEGKLNDLQFSKVALQQLNYVPVQLTLAKFKGLIRKAYTSFYFRPKIFFGLLREIQSAEHFGNILKRVAQTYFV